MLGSKHGKLPDNIIITLGGVIQHTRLPCYFFLLSMIHVVELGNEAAAYVMVLLFGQHGAAGEFIYVVNFVICFVINSLAYLNGYGALLLTFLIIVLCDD